MSYDPQVERYIARARKLRAQYLAHLMRRAWANIRRLAHKISLRSRAIRNPAPLNQKMTAHSVPPGAA